MTDPTMLFRKYLLSELHVLAFVPGKTEDLSDRLLAKAITVNENMKSFGFILSPADVVRLSVSPSLDTFFDAFQELLPDVKAKPMYPNFPKQVMSISAAQFRLHQYLHYLSTYGMELFTGVPVLKGWLPDVKDTPKTKEDKTLLSASLAELVPETEICEKSLTRILSKRERFTLPEQYLVLEAAMNVSADLLKTIEVPFRENMQALFLAVFRDADREQALPVLSALCHHTGDVLKCIRRILSACRYHLRTSQKRTLVRLLEMYPVRDLSENLMMSDTLRERHLRVLECLDYNTYSRSAAHKEVVRQLREGSLRSWEGRAVELVKSHADNALSNLAARPGIMLRKYAWLLSLEYPVEEVENHLSRAAGKLSTQTLLKNVRYFQTRSDKEAVDAELEYEKQCVRNDFRRQEYDIQCTVRNLEWECRSRINAVDRENDLAREKELSEALGEIRRKYDRMEKDVLAEIRKRTLWQRTELEGLYAERRKLPPSWKKRQRTINAICSSYRKYLATSAAGWAEQSAGKTSAADWVEQGTGRAGIAMGGDAGTLPARSSWLDRAQIFTGTGRIRELEKQIQEIKAEVRRVYGYPLQDELLEEEKVSREIREKYEKDPETERRKAEIREQYGILIAEEKKRTAAALTNLPIRLGEELAGLDRMWQRKYDFLARTPEFVASLKRILSAHFSQVTTPLQGKKVFLDMDAFDLKHSTIETNDKSSEGGYIRSGIAFRIPEEAKNVRFFVYWNDPERVDVDLHASGNDRKGYPVTVGWNSNFRKNGIIHSGDITHSNAAEYIDIDLSADISTVSANINLFSGKRAFRDIEECYVGLMAVRELGENVKLYNRKNCFFSHELLCGMSSMHYGYIDVQNRYVKFIGENNVAGYYNRYLKDDPEKLFSVSEYLEILFGSQQVTLTESREDADLILTMGKNCLPNGLSLVEENFFMDC